MGTLFIIITYVMSGQLMEVDRLFLFLLVAIITGICSEGLGLFVGTMFSVTVSKFINNHIFLFFFSFIVLSTYLIKNENTPKVFKSFIKVLNTISYSVTNINLYRKESLWFNFYPRMFYVKLLIRNSKL